jgi:peptidase E
MALRLLLGPQRPALNLGDAIADAGLPAGPVAVIAAGWQEAEGDIDDVAAAARRDVVNLHLYRRAEEVFAADPGLVQAYRLRQDRLQELQHLYGMRLRRTLAAAREMLRAEGDSALVGPEQRHAIAQLRALDRHHLQRVQSLHAGFDSEFDVARHESLARHHAEISEQLAAVETVVITGGNVAVLLNRLLLFDVASLLAGKHLVAWSAGAMALAGRVVLFHDNAPQGRRDPELFGHGLGLLPQQVVLPDAKRRLRMKDRSRLALFSRRLAPAACITLDSGSALIIDGERIAHATGAKQIVASGRLRKVRPT